MKKVYISHHWIFATKDLAIVCGNILNPIEVEVPEDTKVVTGSIFVDPWEEKDFILQVELDGKLDCTDLGDYCPVIEISTQTGYEYGYDDLEHSFTYLESFETKGLNFKIEHLSKELQSQIQATLEQHVKEY